MNPKWGKFSDGVSAREYYDDDGMLEGFLIFSPPATPKTAGIPNADRMVKVSYQAANELFNWLVNYCYLDEDNYAKIVHGDPD